MKILFERFLFAIMLLFVLTCGFDTWSGQENDIIYVPANLPLLVFCDEFNSIKCDDIRSAINYWIEQTSRDYLFQMTESKFHFNITVNYGTPPNNWDGVAYAGDRGLNCDITIVENLSRYSFLSILKHELGHCLGLADDYGTSYIMNGSGWLYRYPDVSPHDIDIVQSWTLD